MSVLTSCKLIIKAKPLELAKFVKNHIRDGKLDLSTLGLGCEYMSNAPYTVREVGKYDINQLNIWIILVGRSACSIDVESDLLKAITERYPNFHIDYGYHVEDYDGRFVFDDKLVICEGEDDLNAFKLEFGFKLPCEFNKLMICGEGKKLVEFIENELEYGRVKSCMWGGNNFDLKSIAGMEKTEISIFFEQDGIKCDYIYWDFYDKYPDFDFRRYCLEILDNRFRITGERGKYITMRNYGDYKYLTEKYGFFTPSKHHYDSFYGYNYTKEAFEHLVFKACEKEKYKNDVCNGLSKMMYRRRLRYKSVLHYDKGNFNTLI